MINRETKKVEICPDCEKDMVLIDLRGVSARSKSSVNGSWYCPNCGRYTKLAKSAQDIASSRSISVYYTIVFAESVSNTVKAELEVSHCTQVSKDGRMFISQTFSNCRSLKKAFEKYSGMHYRHECKIASAVVTLKVDGIEYLSTYKPQDMGKAEFKQLERPSMRAKSGFHEVKFKN